LAARRSNSISEDNNTKSEQTEDMIPIQPIYVIVKKQKKCKDLSKYRNTQRYIDMKKAMSELHIQLMSTAT